MADDKIRVVVKTPNNWAKSMQMDNTLEAFQEMVDGHIECLPVGAHPNLLMICNEDGKLCGSLQPNVGLMYDGKLFDVAVGIVVFCGQNGEEFASLTKDQEREILCWLDEKELPVFETNEYARHKKMEEDDETV